MGRTLPPRIYWWVPGTFSPPQSKETTRLPTSRSANKIYTNDTGAALPWWISLFGQKGNKNNTTYLRVNYMVHEGMWYHDNKDDVCNWVRTIKRHQNKKNVVELVARLLSDPSWCQNIILAKRHDIAHPLWRIVFGVMGCKDSLRRIFLPWVELERLQSSKNQRSHQRQCIPSPHRSNISHRGWTRGDIYNE